MKLLMVTPYFYPKIGGMENYAWEISKGLKRKYGWDIVAVAANHSENKYKEEIIEGIKIYRLAYTFKASNTPINLSWYSQISKIIDKEKPHIINGHTPVPFISDVAARVAYKKHIPFILTYQNDLIKKNILLQFIITLYYVLLGNKTGKISTKIITSSKYYASISDFLKKFKDKVVIVSPGVDLQFFDSIKTPENLISKYNKNKIILFVGQLDKSHIHKGLDILIASVSKLPIDSKLLVIGRGNMEEHYIKIAKNNGLNSRFEIINHADNKKLVEYYKLSDVIVLPSINKSEGFGMVLVEAGASKKPAIGSSIGGIKFVIQDNKTGILVQPGNVDSLTKAIKILLNNVLLAKRYGTAGYKRVMDEFTWEKQVDKTNNLFTNIL